MAIYFARLKRNPGWFVSFIVAVICLSSSAVFAQVSVSPDSKSTPDLNVRSENGVKYVPLTLTVKLLGGKVEFVKSTGVITVSGLNAGTVLLNDSSAEITIADKKQQLSAPVKTFEERWVPEELFSKWLKATPPLVGVKPPSIPTSPVPAENNTGFSKPLIGVVAAVLIILVSAVVGKMVFSRIQEKKYGKELIHNANLEGKEQNLAERSINPIPSSSSSDKIMFNQESRLGGSSSENLVGVDKNSKNDVKERTEFTAHQKEKASLVTRVAQLEAELGQTKNLLRNAEQGDRQNLDRLRTDCSNLTTALQGLTHDYEVRERLQSEASSLPPDLQSWVEALLDTTAKLERNALNLSDAAILPDIDRYVYGNAINPALALVGAGGIEVAKETFQRITFLQAALHSLLKDKGFTVISPQPDTPFDAALHTEIGSVPTNTEREKHNQIHSVRRIGYSYQGKVLRPAEVRRYLYQG